MDKSLKEMNKASTVDEGQVGSERKDIRIFKAGQAIYLKEGYRIWSAGIS